MTKSPNSRIRHGQASCADYGCKREECLKARRDKKKRNRFLRETGRPGYVDSARSMAHLQSFRHAGLQDIEIIKLVGIARTTFYRAMRGEPITRDSEKKILAVPVPSPTGQITTTALCDPTGTHRRLQALIWLGWPIEELEARLGVHAYWISRTFRRTYVRLVLAARVTALYSDLWSLRPESQGVDLERVEEARQYARSQSWVGPLAWDDDAIDDPRAVPQTDALVPVATSGGNVAARWLMGESVILGPEDRRDVIQHLMEWTNDTPGEIAERLDMSVGAMWQTWTRIKKKARTEGRTEPWRRVYVPRDQDLKQNKMGEAA
ncbi:hypothetical protein [Streptomyces collinus]|uniref:hypothetical protein n=1 Tax=Streptomyces collinus TaxID=42684 RepID=UPI00382F6A42